MIQRLSNPPSRRRKLPSAANSCTPRYRPSRRAYLFHLCQNHAFIDGNKRVGANAAITFLLMNDWEPTFDPEELVDLVLAVASSKVQKPELTAIFQSRSRPISNDPNTLTF